MKTLCMLRQEMHSNDWALIPSNIAILAPWVERANLPDMAPKWAEIETQHGSLVIGAEGE